MKVKSFFQNALPSSRRFHRRGQRGRYPNVHFQRNSNERCSTHSQIELENLHKTRSTPKPGPPPRNVKSSGSSRHPLEYDEETQVYNPTSETVEGVNEGSFSDDIRDTLHEIIANGEDNLSSAYPEGCRFARAYATLLCLTVVAFITVLSLTVVYIGLRKSTGKDDNIAAIHSYEMELLSLREWPLQDLESAQLNVSFNTLKREHAEWNFDLLESSEETTTQKSFIKAQVHRPHLPGVFTLNGHLLDPEIEEEVFKSAREILKSHLHADSPSLEILSWKGVATNFVIQELQLRFNVSERQGVLEGVFEDEFCEKTSLEITCNKTGWYRFINGSCNNLRHKTWGSLFSPVRRIVTPTKLTGLPPISTENTAQLTTGNGSLDPQASALLPLWAIFILHDTSKLAESPVPCPDDTEEPNAAIKSCGLVISTDHSQNDSRTVTEDKVKCYQTSNCPADFPSCLVGPRTSFNLVTSYIDASHIYGSSDERLHKLRSGESGKLKVASRRDSQGFLPFASTLNLTCEPATVPNCVFSGDDDANRFGPLTALNTIFVRQHNWIASQLGHINPHWSDDRLFEESRRILIAQMQHITYNEFLPNILGSEIMNFTGLTLERTDFYALYDPVIDPSVSDAYSSAVSYFWSAMAVDKIQLYWKSDKRSAKAKYSPVQEMYRPDNLFKLKGHLEAIIRGLATLSINRVGLEIPKILRSLYVPATNSTINVVQNILEKGRKLELAPYLEWRKVCGLPDLKTFHDLEGHWDTEAVRRVSSVYRDLGQVDLFTGMVAETPFPSSRVGPTLACLLADQFIRFKKGDRYWYEGDVYFHHFTQFQLKSIRKTTLSRILCDNTGLYFNKIHQNPMLLPSTSNPPQDCSAFPELNFHFWKEDLPEDLTGQDNSNSDDEGINDVWIYDESIQPSETPSTTSAQPEIHSTITYQTVYPPLSYYDNITHFMSTTMQN